MSETELEEGAALKLDFMKLRKIASGQENVIPVVVQDVDSREVLLLAYVNSLALETAFQQKRAVFWSTSRNELWIKGNTSGDHLELIDVRINCEQNSLLYVVRPVGKGACHTRDSRGNPRKGCYYRRVKPNHSLEFIEDRK